MQLFCLQNLGFHFGLAPVRLNRLLVSRSFLRAKLVSIQLVRFLLWLAIIQLSKNIQANVQPKIILGGVFDFAYIYICMYSCASIYLHYRNTSSSHSLHVSHGRESLCYPSRIVGISNSLQFAGLRHVPNQFIYDTELILKP